MSVVSCPVARRCFFFTHLLESNWLASWLASLISCVRVSLISLFARTCHSCALLSHVWVCMLCSVCSVRFLFCFATGATCICSCAWIFAGRGRARSSWPLRVMKNKEKGKAGRWQPGLGAPPWGENADLELRSRRGCLQSLNRNRCSDCEVMAAAVWEHTACQPSSKENSNETAAKGSSIRIRMASKGQVSLCEPRIHACLRICPNMPPYAPHGPLHTLDVLIYPDILSHTQSQRERERENYVAYYQLSDVLRAHDHMRRRSRPASGSEPRRCCCRRSTPGSPGPGPRRPRHRGRGGNHRGGGGIYSPPCDNIIYNIIM